MRTRRTPVSCGANQLFDLDNISRQSLERLLQPEYANWSRRDRPGGRDRIFDEDLTVEQRQARQKGEYDNKVYKGETVVFSDADSLGNGKKLLRYIKGHNLGEVTSLSTRNPNTGSNITTYLWVYNGNKLKPERTSRKKTVTERIVLE